MTTPAIGAEATEMRILTAVTVLADTRRRHGGRRRRFPVTRGTGGADVSPGEHEVGLDVVIERPERPVRRVMAGLTLRTELAGMHVLGHVARVAVLGGIVESRRRVTGLARDRLMSTDQRKVREPVIESHVVSHPGHFRMTAIAPSARIFRAL